MSSQPHLRTRMLLILLLAGALLTAAAGRAPTSPSAISQGPYTVVDVESLGMVTFPTGTTFAETEVGGLSGITYDAARGVYYALSDDRSEIDPARFYTVAINVSDGQLDQGDVEFLEVTFLRDQQGNLFEPFALDPEGISLARPGQLFISTEGDANVSPPIDPFVSRFNPAGKQNRALVVPAKFLPDGALTFGVRDNLGFEGLTTMPGSPTLVAATENALVQDGPMSSLTDTSPSRVLFYDLRGLRPGAEYVYCVAPIPQAPIPPTAFADNGLSEILAIDDHGTFLAMERSFAVGVGNTVILYETSIAGATDVSGLEALGLSGCPTNDIEPMSKELVADFEMDLGEDPDNLEALTFGPMLPDGRMLMIAVSDNNFNPSQTTQFIALAVELAPAE